MAAREGRARERQLFTISIAAELVNVHQQTLRHYERLGLVEPVRGKGEIRYYSPDDIDKILQIRRLVEELGVNLAGVEVILNMRDQMERMRQEYEARMQQIRAEHESDVRRLKDIIRRLQGVETEAAEAGF